MIDVIYAKIQRFVQNDRTADSCLLGKMPSVYPKSLVKKISLKYFFKSVLTRTLNPMLILLSPL
jgi:hypothetical protein